MTVVFAFKHNLFCVMISFSPCLFDIFAVSCHCDDAAARGNYVITIEFGAGMSHDAAWTNVFEAGYLHAFLVRLRISA